MQSFSSRSESLSFDKRGRPLRKKAVAEPQRLSGGWC